MILGVLFFPPPAYATKNVSGPTVDAGAWKYELRNGLEFDDRASRDERISQLAFVDYGVNDWLALRTTARWNKPHGSDHELTALEADARIEWIEDRDAGFSLGSRLTYAHQKKAGVADQLSLHTLIEQKTEGGWLMRGNLIFSRDIGADAAKGLQMQISSEIVYDVFPKLALGGEWFGNIGNLKNQSGYGTQQHQIGPVSIWKLTSDSQLEVGYLKGISANAPDSMVKVFIRGNF